MKKAKAIEIIRDVVECYIDINNGHLTSTERAEVIELIDEVENSVCEDE